MAEVKSPARISLRHFAINAQKERNIMAHITDQQITKYYQHELTAKEEIKILQHAAQCEYCAGRLAAGLPEIEMISLPRGVTAGILEKAAKIPDRRQKQREYYRYCTRVALGVCMALGLMVAANFQGNVDLPVTTRPHIISGWESSVSGDDPEKIISKQDSEKLAYQQELAEEKQKQKEQREKFVEKRQQESKREISNWFLKKKK